MALVYLLTLSCILAQFQPIERDRLEAICTPLTAYLDRIKTVEATLEETRQTAFRFPSLPTLPADRDEIEQSIRDVQRPSTEHYRRVVREASGLPIIIQTFERADHIKLLHEEYYSDKSEYLRIDHKLRYIGERVGANERDLVQRARTPLLALGYRLPGTGRRLDEILLHASEVNELPALELDGEPVVAVLAKLPATPKVDRQSGEKEVWPRVSLALWLSKADGFPLQWALQTEVDERRSYVIRFRNRDFQPVTAPADSTRILFPMTIEESLEGSSQRTWQLSDVRLNMLAKEDLGPPPRPAGYSDGTRSQAVAPRN